jgi:extradiol dioxygenase family protein
MMLAPKVRRSTIAAQSRGSVKVFVQPEKDSFYAIPKGETGEQWTMFLLDPAGNALEFKAFADDGQVFAV